MYRCRKTLLKTAEYAIIKRDQVLLDATLAAISNEAFSGRLSWSWDPAHLNKDNPALSKFSLSNSTYTMGWGHENPFVLSSRSDDPDPGFVFWERDDKYYRATLHTSDESLGLRYEDKVLLFMLTVALFSNWPKKRILYSITAEVNILAQ